MCFYNSLDHLRRESTALGVGEPRAKEDGMYVLSSLVYESNHLESNFLVLNWEACLQNHFGLVVIYQFSSVQFYFIFLWYMQNKNRHYIYVH